MRDFGYNDGEIPSFEIALALKRARQKRKRHWRWFAYGVLVPAAALGAVCSAYADGLMLLSGSRQVGVQVSGIPQSGSWDSAPESQEVWSGEVSYFAYASAQMTGVFHPNQITFNAVATSRQGAFALAILSTTFEVTDATPYTLEGTASDADSLRFDDFRLPTLGDFSLHGVLVPGVVYTLEFYALATGNDYTSLDARFILTPEVDTIWMVTLGVAILSLIVLRSTHDDR